MKKIIFVMAILFSCVFSAEAFALVGVEGRYWLTDLSATSRVSGNGLAGDSVDYVKDLGLDGRNGFGEGRVSLSLGSHNLRYAFVPMKWSGDATLSSTVVFAGKSYTASSAINSEIKVDYHRLGYEYMVLDTLGNQLGVILEVKYIDASASLKASSLGLSESKSLKAPIPAVGIGGQVGLPFLINVGGEITGMSLGSNIYMYDAEAGVNIKPLPFVTVSGGYRVLSLHLENNSDLLNFRVKGPFVAIKASF